MKNISDDHEYIGHKADPAVNGYLACEYAQSGDGRYNSYGNLPTDRTPISPNPKDRTSKGWYKL